MCGITGIFGNIREEEFNNSIYRMSKALTHRGPDDAGIWVNTDNRIALGHQRLPRFI